MIWKGSVIAIQNVSQRAGNVPWVVWVLERICTYYHEIKGRTHGPDIGRACVILLLEAAAIIRKINELGRHIVRRADTKRLCAREVLRKSQVDYFQGIAPLVDHAVLGLEVSVA